LRRELLSLRKPPDPAKIAQSLQMGFRFVERKGNRYILQARVLVGYDQPMSPAEHTWIDIPLVPETYEAQS
jgi:hypothetical protein